MSKLNKPTINTKPVAGNYESANEKVIEFEGGLISFRKLDNGTFVVDLYRLDKNVIVQVNYENGSSIFQRL